MLKIGLTGGIGSGKTTISKLFAELGVTVIDADIIARGLLQPGHPAFDQTLDALGKRFLEANGHINRQQLRRWVFDHPDDRKRLEAIIHPYVRREIAQQLDALAVRDMPYCLVVAPLLIEAKQTDLVDRVLVIQADMDICRQRVVERDRLTAEEADKIMQAQLDQKTRLAHADDVINNDVDLATLKRRVQTLHRKYLELAGSQK